MPSQPIPQTARLAFQLLAQQFQASCAVLEAAIRADLTLDATANVDLAAGTVVVPDPPAEAPAP